MTTFFQELDQKEDLEMKQAEKRMRNKEQTVDLEKKKREKEKQREAKEKQREANQERRRTLNRERMQRYRKNMLAKKHEQENQQLKKENQQLKEELSRKQSQPEERPNDEQKQINKQNEIITKLQDHVNQVFGEEGSIDEEDDTKDEEAGSIDEEDDIKDDYYDSMSQDTIEGEEPIFSDEERPGGTDFTQCIAIENDKRCTRSRRNGDYCWLHDPENPQLCHKCGKRLLIKQGAVVNGRTKDATGLFEECDCDKPVDNLDMPSTNVAVIADVPPAPVSNAPPIVPIAEAPPHPASSIVFCSS
jgi:hypothetical protein